MAQAEDTELRDLVIDALEKNGSLAKIRALLRANIFLAFEEDCENVKGNPYLDNILQMPEGLLSLSLIHEFLEYTNLRNTMFVYVTESRQGKDYKYEGRKRLADRFANLKREAAKEPLLVTIIKTFILSQNIQDARTKTSSVYKNGMKDDENCTYIVHDDSSSVSSHVQSQSDNSSDEKNKLRLTLDNLDTDTSSDSTRDKTSSEYIANENIIIDADSDNDCKKSHNGSTSPVSESIKHMNNCHSDEFKSTFAHTRSDILNAHSSDSSLELQRSKMKLEKTFNIESSKLLHDISKKPYLNTQLSAFNSMKERERNETKSPTTIKPEDIINKNVTQDFKTSLDNTDVIASDYSLDFSVSGNSSQNNNSKKESPVHDDTNMNGCLLQDSPRLESNSTRSSVSISDVADLLDIDSPKRYKDNEDSISLINKDIQMSKAKKSSRDSDDFSVSSVPSLSNLSLDLHSD